MYSYVVNPGFADLGRPSHAMADIGTGTVCDWTGRETNRDHGKRMGKMAKLAKLQPEQPVPFILYERANEALPRGKSAADASMDHKAG